MSSKISICVLLVFLCLTSFSLAQEEEVKQILGTVKADNLVNKTEENAVFKGFQKQDTLRSVYATSSEYLDGAGQDRLFLGQNALDPENLATVTNGGGNDLTYGQNLNRLQFQDGLGNDTLYFRGEELAYIDGPGDDQVSWNAPNTSRISEGMVLFKTGDNTYTGNSPGLFDGEGDDTYNLYPAPGYDPEDYQTNFNFLSLREGGNNTIHMKQTMTLVLLNAEGNNTFYGSEDSHLDWIPNSGNSGGSQYIYNRQGTSGVTLKRGNEFLLRGGPNADLARLGLFNSLDIKTGAGDDIIEIRGSEEGNQENSIYAGAGNDRLRLGAIDGYINLGPGNDDLEIDTYSQSNQIINAKDGEIDRVECISYEDDYSEVYVIADEEDTIYNCGTVVN